MSISIDHQEGTAVIKATGRLDSSSVDDLEALVKNELDKNAKHLIFDFSELVYINSSGLRVLVLAYQKLSGGGGNILVCGLKDYIQEVFSISGYDKIFKLFPQCDTALESVQNS
ncbi:STAS domain-containing protein [Desulfobaculum bizertense]|uniref:Anti-sigma factor antagonist n=1 Tax=Desulfobaculum bizertense DSM 18034 TaxID=1121442 RepID=A0A1T4WPR9_9BACT|nr:STAS domain-containing protein [Desulfobaculum bizertense]SKA79107.1 anti-sigma B factor antagonist [Desulfobaculum bizertense DSM 18034]